MVFLSLIPAVVFLLFLLYADSFKLIHIPTLLVAALWGILAAIVSLICNKYALNSLNIEFKDYSRYIAPVFEEIIKILIFIVLLKKGRVGFMIDGAIYGFTVGAMFALFENVYYHFDPSNPNPMVWVLRGFGTSMMHGGSTAIVLLFAMKSVNTGKKIGLAMVQGTLIAMAIHSLFNHFFISPLLSTIVIILILPPVLLLIFQSHEIKLRKWLEIELNTEVELLKMIREGKFSQTKTGQYIINLKNRFSAEVILDMLCYLDLYTELSIKAKSVMLLKETGFPVMKEPGVEHKLKELKALEHNIGKTGRLALSPVLRMDQKDLWKLNQLNN